MAPFIKHMVLIASALTIGAAALPADARTVVARSGSPS
jgi:hypothetical protein